MKRITKDFMNLIELRNNFPTELDCIVYAECIRWEKGVICAYCGSKKLGPRNIDYRYHCKDCQRSFSVTVNTRLHDTRLPLSTWFSAISVITDAKKGMSAKQLERNLGVSYPTAWKMYHTIRGMMQEENPAADSLSGIVEMDETYIGGKPRKMSKFPKNRKEPELDEQIKELKGKGYKFNRQKGNSAKPDLNPKRGYGDKIRVTGIVERNGNVIAEVMKVLTTEEIKKMVEKYVDEDNAVLITDQASGYSRIHKIIDHISVDHSRMYSYRGVNTNSIESFWAIIKRGIMGQYHSVSERHLPAYVSEFVFKYNNRKETDIMFEILLESALKTIEN